MRATTAQTVEQRLEWDSPMYRLAVAQLDSTAERMGLDPNIWERLRTPQRAHVVSFPFRRDDYDTVETVTAYRGLSLLHERAAPLILRLWERADRTGIPPTRPLWLEFPGDARAAGQQQEWTLGDDVLVAPVVTEGATSRTVYFPAGCWRDPQTHRTERGPRSATVPAPLTRLPYFFRCGTRPFRPASPTSSVSAEQL